MDICTRSMKAILARYPLRSVKLLENIVQGNLGVNISHGVWAVVVVQGKKSTGGVR